MGAGRVILPAVQASARRTIVAWTLYDFANSAFAAVVLSTVYPAYYANVVVGNAEGRGDFWWGAAVSTAMVIGALTSPPLGGVADHAGARKPFFVGFSVACIVVTALMATVGHGMALWGWTLAVAGIVTYEAAFVYYNSYLPRIAPPERIGGVGAADRFARPALRRDGQPRAVGPGDRRLVLRRHQGPVLGGGRPRRHRPRRHPGREPHLHGHPGAARPRGRVLRFLFAGGQDGSDLRPARVRRRPPSSARPLTRDDSEPVNESREVEERHGFPGPLRTLGGLGGHFGAPHF